MSLFLGLQPKEKFQLQNPVWNTTKKRERSLLRRIGLYGWEEVHRFVGAQLNLKRRVNDISSNVKAHRLAILENCLSGGSWRRQGNVSDQRQAAMQAARALCLRLTFGLSRPSVHRSGPSALGRCFIPSSYLNV